MSEESLQQLVRDLDAAIEEKDALLAYYEKQIDELKAEIQTLRCSK